MLSLRAVSYYEVKTLYSHLKRDFAFNERMPYYLLKKNYDKRTLECFYLTEAGRDKGYVLCVMPENQPYVHIQYLAILPECRSEGLGGKLLGLVGEYYPDKIILLEVEDPAGASSARDFTIRRKRISFYKRNGFHLLEGVTLRLFGVKMLCMAKTNEPIHHPQKIWRQCYGQVLPVSFLERFVEIQVRTPEDKRFRPGRYRHFKGNEYQLLFTARNSETEELMVVYRPLYGEGGYWVRPAAMWNELVERDGKKIPRFRYIGDM